MANSMRGGTNRRRSEEKSMGEDARGIDRMEGDETKRGHGGKKEEVKERGSGQERLEHHENKIGKGMGRGM